MKKIILPPLAGLATFIILCIAYPVFGKGILSLASPTWNSMLKNDIIQIITGWVILFILIVVFSIKLSEKEKYKTLAVVNLFFIIIGLINTFK